MQNNGRRKLSDRVSNKNSNSFGVGLAMREYSVYGPQLKAIDERKKFLSEMDSDDRKQFSAMIKVARQMQRDAEDAPIIASYDAKKEELEHLYKMPDSNKKWTLIKAKKAELDEMYTKNVCIRKHAYSIKQANKARKIDADLAPFKRDLMNIGGRVMRESEFKSFLERAKTHVEVKNDGKDSWFFFDDIMYKSVKVKNGYTWSIQIL